jgi:hypothetical protein
MGIKSEEINPPAKIQENRKIKSGMTKLRKSDGYIYCRQIQQLRQKSPASTLVHRK